MSETHAIPQTIFKVRDGTVDGGWKDSGPAELWDGKKVLVFGLPGAFTPTCTTKQLPGFDEEFDAIKALGFDDIYCVSVNDSFVMNAWAQELNLSNVKLIPDGTGDFTRQMGMLVKKDNLGFGYRSWRYCMVVDNGVVTDIWEETGKMDNCPDDPYEVTTPYNIIDELSESKHNVNLEWSGQGSLEEGVPA